MKLFRGIRLVYRILKAIGEVEAVNQQRLRRIIHDYDTLTLQQNTNRNLSSHMDDMSDRMLLMEAEVKKMREAAEFFGNAAEALAKEVMIRLRIERKTIDFTPENDGLCWYEKGQIVGRVIIEQQEIINVVSPNGMYQKNLDWVPVEVIDEERKS